MQLLTVAVVDLSTGRTFMVGAFPYAVRKMLDLGMVTEFKTKIEMARCWTCSRGTSACPGSSSTRGTGPRSS
ncbi:Archaeal putative transposase ISC1217 [Metallosphaera yellowstonensis MK1]|uniref:Archaeal putative transposase ISC1217 n=1 Tax=Metallosphaera yellowstonensis MK1 TaxID=671065 RepID=H2C3U5_9CREN|nr:Archaeal putative transposase ISC1217 [Metallosphaera yellowstonensis MK1]